MENNSDIKKERLSLTLDDDIDITSLTRTKVPFSTMDRDSERKSIESAAQESGFTKREPKKSRRRTRRSPYSDQKSIRVRPAMKVLVEDIADELDINDYVVFEMAILALLEDLSVKLKLEEKASMKAMVKRYKDIVDKKS